MSESAENNMDDEGEPRIGFDVLTEEDPFAVSATPIQGRRKGFPVMPPLNDMLSMIAVPPPSAREKHRARNGPPIKEWEAVLLGRRLVMEGTEDSEDTFKKSDLPANTRFFPGPMMARSCTGRLNMWLGAGRVVIKVYYG